jgi:3-oxoacyl-[acyl-carrier-protein] synthase-1
VIRPAFLNALGIVCALGASSDEVVRRLFAGESGLIADDRYSPGRATPLGAYDGPLPPLDGLPVELHSRNNALVIAAARQIAPAVAAAVDRYGAHRVAVAIGSSTSGISESEGAIRHLLEDGRLPDEFHLAQQELASPARMVARALGATGPAHVISTACASSAKALASAARLLQLGLADAVVTGGVDTIGAFTLAGFDSLQLISTDRCNPLSANRKGINLGEAAALFLMTREPATVGLRGWGETTDGYHFSAPDPQGIGARMAIEQALVRGGASAKSVEYINLHGTGTHQNDATESVSIHATLGDAIPMSSTKPLSGHALGAAGALEAAFCWLTMQDENRTGRLPPHLWDGIADPALPELHIVAAGETLGHPPRLTLSTSFAFGGANAVLLLGRE